jgi:PAS domain S-box-containing protein
MVKWMCLTMTKFKSLLEAVPDALVGMDQQGVIRFVNRQTESLFGYDRDQLVGQPIQRLVPESLWQIYAEHQQNYFADPRTRSSGVDVELSGRHHDGTQFPINVSLSHIDTGDVLLVITAVRDVATHQQAVKNAQLIAAIVEYSDDAIIGSSLDGNVTSWNLAAAGMYGYSSKEIVGKPTRSLTLADRAGEVRVILAEIKAGRHVDNFETRRVRKDGTVLPVLLTVAPIRDENGAIIGASAVHREVTAPEQSVKNAQLITAIVQGSDDAITSSTLDGIVTSWNPAAERMYGYFSAEIIGKPAKIITPKDRDGEIEAVLEHLKGGQHVDHLETKRIRKDGSVIPVSLTLSPIRDKNNAVVGASVIHRDLTEQTGALASAQRIAAIVEYSDDAIIGETLDGIITSWNPAAERMFGYSSRQIVSKPIDLLIPEDRAGEMISILAKISAGRPVDNFETVRVRQDGTVFTVSLTISPICDENGAVVAASVICRDVSELNQAARYTRSLIEAALDPLVTISAKGRITDVNEATVKATGVPRNKLVGTDFSDYFTEPDKANRLYRLVFGRGSATDYPLTLRHRDGTLTEVLYNASVYRDAGGRVLGVFAAARDMSRQMQAKREAAEQRAGELERLAELERFQRLAFGHELTTIELQKEIELLRKFGPAKTGDPGAPHT